MEYAAGVNAPWTCFPHDALRIPYATHIAHRSCLYRLNLLPMTRCSKFFGAGSAKIRRGNAWSRRYRGYFTSLFSLYKLLGVSQALNHSVGAADWKYTPNGVVSSGGSLKSKYVYVPVSLLYEQTQHPRRSYYSTPARGKRDCMLSG